MKRKLTLLLTFSLLITILPVTTYSFTDEDWDLAEELIVGGDLIPGATTADLLPGGRFELLDISVGGVVPVDPSSIDAVMDFNEQSVTVPAGDDGPPVAVSQYGDRAILNLVTAPDIERVLQGAEGTISFDLTELAGTTTVLIHHNTLRSFAEADQSVEFQLAPAAVTLDPTAALSSVSPDMGAHIWVWVTLNGEGEVYVRTGSQRANNPRVVGNFGDGNVIVTPNE